jgi:two-component system NarL family sensor kinase
MVIVLSAVSVLVRFRRPEGRSGRSSSGFLYAAAIFAVAEALAVAMLAVSGDPLLQGLSSLATFIGFDGIPCALTVAILRFHLYEIDVIIRRTLVHGLLTALLAVSTPAQSWPSGGRWGPSTGPWAHCTQDVL